MLSLLTAPLAAAVDAMLAGAPAGRVVVIGDAALHRRLALRGRDAALVALPPAPPGAPRELAPLEVADGALVAVVASHRCGPPAPGDPSLREWHRAVREDGVVILLDRGEPTEAARRALCGGLTEIRQRTTGRTIVTCGRVVKLD